MCGGTGPLYRDRAGTGDSAFHQGSPGVQKTSIAFAKFETPVRFDENDLDKDAALFFTLAAVDEEEHLKNMRQLFLILSDEELLEKLAQANTAEELLELDQLLS